MRVLLLLVLLQLSGLAAACEPAQQLTADDPARFREVSEAQQPVDPDDPDYSLLAQAIFFETNSRRLEHGLEPLEHLTALDRAACVHARAMVEEEFFAHRNPNDPRLATPADRVRAQDLEIGFVAENIGEVFALQYQSGETVYPREEAGRTVFSREPGGEPLDRRSYLEIAEALVDGWMSSPGHRRNILAEEAHYLGAGCQATEDDGLEMPMFACVQLFFTPLGELD